MLTIVKGSDRTFDIYLVKESDGRPYDLTDWTAIKARFLNADATILEVDTDSEISVVGRVELGHIRITLSDTQTGSLAEADRGDIEIEVVKSSTTNIFQLEDVIKVVKKLFT